MTSDTQRSEFVLVPREPTEAMILAGVHHDNMGDMTGRYRAMLAAAPTTPKVGSGELDAAGLEAGATAEAAIDGREFSALGRADRDRYTSRLAAAIRAYLALAAPVDHPEPAAWQIGEGGLVYASKKEADKHVAGWAAQNIDCGPIRPLYAALQLSDSPALEAGVAWQTMDSAPKGQKLLAGYRNDLGNWRTITARYYLAGTLDASENCDDADEDGYAPEGWYEESETHEYILPCVTPLCWMPLPAALSIPAKEDGK